MHHRLLNSMAVDNPAVRWWMDLLTRNGIVPGWASSGVWDLFGQSRSVHFRELSLILNTSLLIIVVVVLDYRIQPSRGIEVQQCWLHVDIVWSSDRRQNVLFSCVQHWRRRRPRGGWKGAIRGSQGVLPSESGTVRQGAGTGPSHLVISSDVVLRRGNGQPEKDEIRAEERFISHLNDPNIG
ncbi:hypothetical protein CLAIMM_14399 [Cladophialophora immunda]|nr:hypothetical protein CLAIMM_14399 [Cladophialophora immunda]